MRLPDSEREREIVAKINAKRQVILDNYSDPKEIRRHMKFSLGPPFTAAELEYAEKYTDWLAEGNEPVQPEQA